MKNKIQILFYINCLLIIINLNFISTQNDDLESCQTGKNCILPFCNCDSAELPLKLPKHVRYFELPQLVILTIDDQGLDVKSYQVYRKLLESHLNPNGCPVKATFFISDSTNETSFCLTRNIYEKGHEIGVSTVNYTCPHKRCSPLRDFQPWDYEQWSDQILNMRLRLTRYAGIPQPDITGFRAPLLEPASDMHYRIIAANNFLYDSSLILNTDDIIWPFTFNYKFKSYLSNNGPIHLYSGLWELPVPNYIDLDNKNLRCLKLWEGHCNFEKSAFGVARFLRRHFLRAYYHNRAPIVFHFNAEWLKEFIITNTTEIIPDVGYSNKEKTKVLLEKKEYINLDGVIKFMTDTLENNKDVYFVTARQAIEWMKLLPRVKSENITELIKELFDDCEKYPQNFDGQCPALKQVEPDYDTEQSLILDDSYGEELRKKLKIDRSEKNLLTDLQSEVLFVNDFVLYFVLALAVILVFIIVQDRFF